MTKELRENLGLEFEEDMMKKSTKENKPKERGKSILKKNSILENKKKVSIFVKSEPEEKQEKKPKKSVMFKNF